LASRAGECEQLAPALDFSSMTTPVRVPRSANRWTILAVVTLVAFVTNLDATIVIIGLPRIVASLHTSITVGLWTVTAYIITSTVFLLPAGRWSDSSGRRACFVFGLCLFTAGTLACGLSASGAQLIAFRLAQGVGGAFGVATGTPVLVDVFPPKELGRALGTNATAWVVGSIVGPVAGGAIVSGLGWRWIFFVTVPFGVIGAALGWKVIPDPAAKDPRVRTDWLGIATFTTALVGLLMALSEGLAWGWTSWRILVLFGAVVLFGVLFFVLETHIDEPLFDLAVVRNTHYRIGAAVALFYGTGFFATTFLLAFYLQGALRLGPLDAGLLLIPLSAPQVVLAPLGGHIADRYGSAPPMLFGLVLLIGAAVWLAQLGPKLNIVAVVMPLLLMSIANGFTWPPLIKAVMSSAPAGKSGAASGIFYTVRNFASSLSFTLALVVAELTLPPALAVKIYLGSSHLADAATIHALVHSTDIGFKLFVAFYVVALLFALALLRPVHEGRDAKKQAAIEASKSVSSGRV